MDRIKVERAIDGLAEWQKHVQTNSDIDRDISTAIEALKAQLSQKDTTKGATSDLISRTETAEHLRRVLEATVPNTDYDEGYIDGIEFGISTVSTLPSIQSQSTAGQPNDGVRSTARSTDLIDRQQTLDALIGAVKKVGILDADDIKAVFDMLPTIQPVATDTNDGDTISRQAAIDIERNATVDTNPSHFEAHQKFMQFMDDVEVSSFGRWQWANGFNTALTAVGIDLKKLPTVQPEPHEGHWIRTDCGLDVECKCSECGYRDFVEPRDEYWFNRNFCPNCGARMKGERQK